MYNNSTYAMRGTVQIYEKDKGGGALQFCLQTEEFEKYIIENGSDYIDLSSLIGKQVLIYCEKLTVEHHNLPYIKIKSYKTFDD